MIVFEPYGTVELHKFNADDLSVVNAARVSFAKFSEVYTGTDEKVLRFLMRERHGTPFEHNFFNFHIRAPIVVWWEWVRHRVASYNLESGRYVELRSDFYVPEVARVQEGTPGQYYFADGRPEQTAWLQTELRRSACEGYQKYLDCIELGIAKEQARLFLPMTLYVEGFFSCNARSLMNFLSLRNDKHAMYEIRQYAVAIEELWSKVMPDTAKAFVEFGRNAP